MIGARRRREIRMMSFDCHDAKARLHSARYGRSDAAKRQPSKFPFGFFEPPIVACYNATLSLSRSHLPQASLSPPWPSLRPQTRVEHAFCRRIHFTVRWPVPVPVPGSSPQLWTSSDVCWLDQSVVGGAFGCFRVVLITPTSDDTLHTFHSTISPA